MTGFLLTDGRESKRRLRALRCGNLLLPSISPRPLQRQPQERMRRTVRLEQSALDPPPPRPSIGGGWLRNIDPASKSVANCWLAAATRASKASVQFGLTHAPGPLVKYAMLPPILLEAALSICSQIVTRSAVDMGRRQYFRGPWLNRQPGILFPLPQALTGPRPQQRQNPSSPTPLIPLDLLSRRADKARQDT